MKEIYLDNSATTKVCENAIEKMVYIMREGYGNPSSLHQKGFEAECELKEARKKVASVINAEPEEIFFTSGGTESDNTAIFGAAKRKGRFGKKIVTTMTEHHAVLNPMKELEKQGFKVVYLKPDKNGHISSQSVFDAVDEETILVSMMAVNNETGAIFPIESAQKAISENGGKALLHIDAVQAYGKLPMSVLKTKADFISISAHKIHGPKGVGALYVRKGINLPPMLFGGGQEKNLRSGTEALPSIAGFGAAAEILRPEKSLPEMQKLCDRCRSGLSDIDGLVLQSPEDALPYIVNFSIPGIRSEVMLHFLSAKGIYVSSGSACAGGAKSHVLEAMGLPREQIDSSIRASFSSYTTAEEIDIFINAVKEGSETLMRVGNKRGIRR